MVRDPTAIEVHAARFKALGESTRLRIVAMLTHGELCVCHLVDVLELPQSTVSRHLAVLRDAHLVQTRRSGRWIHYRLSALDDELHRWLALLAEQTGLTARAARSRRSCGPRDDVPSSEETP